jgi:hypothetical protein
MKTNSNRPNNNNETLSGTFYNFLENSTVHGTSHLTSKHKISILRLLWILFMMISIVFCGSLIYKGIDNYLKYDVVTTVRLKKQPHLKFPMVTICLLDPIITEEAFKLIQTIRTKDNFSINDAFNETMDFKTSKGVFDLVSTYWKRNINFQYSKLLKVSIDEILIECLFVGGKCPQPEHVTKDSGNCYRYNSGKNENISIAGRTQDSLSWQIFIHRPSKYKTVSLTSGLRVYINDQSVGPHEMNSINQILVIFLFFFSFY